MSEISVTEAAARLGLNPSRVRALVAHGLLAGRRVGGRWLVDARAVEDRGEAVPGTRPMSPRIAWAAAALLDDHDAPWSSSSERARLRARLRAHRPGDGSGYRAWLRSRASQTRRYRVDVVTIPTLLAAPGVVTGGISAASAHGVGVGVGFGAEAEVYADVVTADRLVADFVLPGSDRPNLTVRVADGNRHRRTARPAQGRLVAPRLITAADLLDADDSRSRRAGSDLLNRAWDEAFGGRVGEGRGRAAESRRADSPPGAPGRSPLTPAQARVLRALSQAPLGLETVDSVAHAAGLALPEAAKAAEELRARGLVTVETQTVPGATARPVEVWQANPMSSEWQHIAAELATLPQSPSDEDGRVEPTRRMLDRVPDRVAHLFWNAPLDQLTVSDHAAYLAGRVLGSEDAEALAWAAEVLPPAAWSEAARSRGLDPTRRALARNLAAAAAE